MLKMSFAAYRQVFGNRHLMELDLNPSIEALFMNGDLTVQGSGNGSGPVGNL